ncbi:MAG: prepilin-type N-terminal cleavage/methylation domain-containing protein [Candidatus Dojkabacteria bacterium]|nr:MAG: prepilin-type N-terminal cleavage/methylation domain-containing protein [Candidatus Dojkabacteria bacterium]
MGSKYKGFTLIEIVVVIGIMIAAFAVVFPLTVSQIRENKLISTAEEVAGAIFEAQQYAYNKKNGLGYGIKFNSDSYEYISGANYNEAVADDLFTIESGVDVTESLFGTKTDIFFQPGSVRPDDPGEITISDGALTVTVSINSEGAIFIND